MREQNDQCNDLSAGTCEHGKSSNQRIGSICFDCVESIKFKGNIPKVYIMTLK